MRKPCLPVSVEDRLIDLIVRTYKPEKVNLDAIVEKAKLVNLKQIARCIADGEPKDVVYSLMNATLEGMRNLTKEIYGTIGVQDIGASEYRLVRTMLFSIAGNDAPEFVQRLREFIARPEVAADDPEANFESPAVCVFYFRSSFFPDEGEATAVAPLRERKAAVAELPASFGPNGAATQRALALGYAKSEIPMLKNTAELYLRETGCAYEEAVAAVKGCKQSPLPKYMSTASLGLEAYNGTTAAGRGQLEQDLVRPFTYKNAEPKKNLLGANEEAFNFRFPGEGPIATNETQQGKANIKVVCDKIENLCGKVHPAQASSVMAMVSQPGLAYLRGGLWIVLCSGAS